LLNLLSPALCFLNYLRAEGRVITSAQRSTPKATRRCCPRWPWRMVRDGDAADRDNDFRHASKHPDAGNGPQDFEDEQTEIKDISRRTSRA